MRSRLPSWFRQALPPAASGGRVKQLLGQLGLHTVCEGARCPNRAACWHDSAAAFLILGNVCTRDCRFCAIPHEARPAPPDPGEPARLAEAAAAMGLRHVVVTSVTRDDLPDGGAAHFAATIREIRSRIPGAAVEVLIPDFQGDPAALAAVLAAQPDILNHNLETVARLYKQARPGSDYQHSLDLLKRYKAMMPNVATKSGIMVGLGETDEEVLQVMQDLRRHDVEMITVGQYLQPSDGHLPVLRYVTPDQFKAFETHAYEIGFKHAAIGAMVRSSYHADVQAEHAGVVE